MSTNIVFEPGNRLNVVVSDPAVPVAGDPVRYGFATGIAETDEGGGGNIATETSVNFGMYVADHPVTDTIGGGIAVGAALFYVNGAPGTIENTVAGFFYGFALEAVGAGLTATIRVLHVPAPGSGTLGAGTIATANLAVGILSADAPGRALMANNYFTTAQWLAASTAGSWTTAVLLDQIAADQITNAVLLQCVLNGAFVADAATRALFAAGFVSEALIDPNTLTGTVAANVADDNLIGGIPVVHKFLVPDAATGDVDFVLTHKEQIFDVLVQKTGGAGGAANSVQVQTGAGAAISDVIVTNIADTTLARALTIDDASATIAAGGTLRLHRIKAGGNAECVVFVTALRSA